MAHDPQACRGLRKRPDCFMVRLALVTHPGEADHPPPRSWPRRKRWPVVRLGARYGRIGPGRVGIRRCRVAACVAPLSGHGRGLDMREVLTRASAPDRPARQGRQTLNFHAGCFPLEHKPRCQGPKIVEIMIAAGPTLTNSSATPIFSDGMICFRRVRPDDFPILERTGHPFPITPFRCPPARAPIGPVRLRRAAHRSSGVDDQAHADRCHARGGNPRRRAGW